MKKDLFPIKNIYESLKFQENCQLTIYNPMQLFIDSSTSIKQAHVLSILAQYRRIKCAWVV